MLERADVLRMDRRRLMEALRAGAPIEAGALDDWEYRGVSLGLGQWIERLTWKTFQKVFHRDPATGDLRGWNVRVEQRGLDAASVPRTRKGVARTFGHYRVVSPEGRRLPRALGDGHFAGLLIDYGLGGNGRLDPLSRMRDPLVALHPGSTELLLGWSYVDLGFVRFGTPSFFVLERERRITHYANPPRSLARL